MSVVLHFDGFDADLAAGQLRRHGVRVKLRDQSFLVLELLLERPGEVVTREELRQKLWPADVFVDFENSLNTAVGRLREALGDSAEHPRYIETLPRRGYRFLAEVAAAAPASGTRQSGAESPDVVSPGRRDSNRPRPHACGPDPVAYQEYVEGRRHLYRFRSWADAAVARSRFERAVAEDPEYALAHEALAELCWFQGYLGLMPPTVAVAEGTLHAVRAIEIDDTRAEPHALLAQFHKQLGYNWPDVERELARARHLDPESTLVRGLYVIGWLMPQGRVDECVAELEAVLERDPLSMWTNHWLGVMLLLARRWERLAKHAEAMIALDPLAPWGHWLLAGSCRLRGLADAAIAAGRTAVELSGGFPFMLGWHGMALGSCGRVEEARDVLGRLHDLAREIYVPPSSYAWVHLGLRDVDCVFEWLDRAVDARDQFLMPIKTYAFLDPLRHDPRFAALLRKMRLDPAPLTG